MAVMLGGIGSGGVGVGVGVGVTVLVMVFNVVVKAGDEAIEQPSDDILDIPV